MNRSQVALHTFSIMYGSKSYGKQRKVSRVKQTQPFILGIVGVTL